jgi:hypothetical protein
VTEAAGAEAGGADGNWADLLWDTVLWGDVLCGDVLWGAGAVAPLSRDPGRFAGAPARFSAADDFGAADEPLPAAAGCAGEAARPRDRRVGLPDDEDAAAGVVMPPMLSWPRGEGEGASEVTRPYRRRTHRP